MTQDDDRLIPDAKLRERYGVSDMTIWRWDHDPALGFPAPIRIKGRKYRRLSELLLWERARAAGKEDVSLKDQTNEQHARGEAR
jgi:predicted DNA-binding transcriptional regulator AlpA